MHSNYLLFMPSVMQNNRSPIEYTVADSGLTFRAAQTNVPATEYIIANLAARGEKLNKIIMLCSDEVLQNEVTGGEMQPPMTTYEHYVREISDWMSKHGYAEDEIKNAFFHIRLQDINPGSYKSTESIRVAIERQLAGEGERHLFLDYTGGLRSASMMLIMFARLLEVTGVTVEDVLYSRIYLEKSGKTCGLIESCMDTYHIFRHLDAYSAARSGNLEPLFQLAVEEGDTDMIDEIERTKASKTIITFRKVDAEDRTALYVDEHMDITRKNILETVNEQRKNLTQLGFLKTTVASGDIARATDIIREKGLQILVDTGYLTWTRVANKKQPTRPAGQEVELSGDENTYFFAYTCYYRTYLRFVCNMLYALKDVSDPNEWLRRSEEYIQKETQLVPAYSVDENLCGNSFLRKEFAEYCAHTKWSDHPLLLKFRQDTQADDGTGQDKQISCAEIRRIRGSAAYKQEYNKYMTTYLKKGFPFANIYKDRGFRSYSSNLIIDENGDTTFQWYGKTFKSALEESVKIFSQKPEEERRQITQDAIPWAGINTIPNAELLPITLIEAFPPAEMCSLFTFLDKGDIHFGKHLILMDRIRKLRNLFSHNGYQVGAAIIVEAIDLVNQFIAWTETLIPDAGQTE